MGDFEHQLIYLKNIEDLWGKGIWDASSYATDKGLVGPLKIIKLPSDRTPAVTIKDFNENYILSAIQSLRGSVI